MILKKLETQDDADLSDFIPEKPTFDTFGSRMKSLYLNLYLDYNADNR